MSEKSQRRTLAFRSLDEVIADVDNLHASGYEKAGSWDLAQVCEHIAYWMRCPVAGFPKPGCFISVMLWFMKVFAGRRWKRKMLATGKMPAGRPTFPGSVYPPNVDEAAAIKKLKEAVCSFKEHMGEYIPSPVFGRMTREETLGLQLVHCAHHLSFLLPKGN